MGEHHQELSSSKQGALAELSDKYDKSFKDQALGLDRVP